MNKKINWIGAVVMGLSLTLPAWAETPASGDGAKEPTCDCQKGKKKKNKHKCNQAECKKAGCSKDGACAHHAAEPAAEPPAEPKASE